MERRWRGMLIAGATGAVAVLGFVVARASSDHDASAGSAPRGRAVGAGEDPGAVGSATAIVDLPTPRDANRICTETVTAANPCRITTSLREPDPPERRGPPPEQFDPPASLGEPALLDAADPSVLVDGQTYSLFSTSAAWRRLPTAPGAPRGGTAVLTRHLPDVQAEAGAPQQVPRYAAGLTSDMA